MIVTLYSKPGCHLCEEARELLDQLAPERGFTVEEIDIEKDRALFERYRYEIPVVLLAGAEVARGRIDERQLAKALRTKNEEHGTKN